MKKLNWMSRLILLGGFLYLGSASAVMINFSPGSETVNVGDVFDVDVVVSDLAAGEVVFGFDLDVLFDPAILSAQSVTFGNILGPNHTDDLFEYIFDPSVDAWTQAYFLPGAIDFSEVTKLSIPELDALQGDSVTLATLGFLALAEGSSVLYFDPVTYPGIDVKDKFADPIVFDTVGEASITVIAAQIPEPGILLLMMTGLLGLGMAQRKRIF